MTIPTFRRRLGCMLLLIFSFSDLSLARQADDRSKFLYLNLPEAQNVVYEYQHHMHAPSHEVLASRSEAHEQAAEVLLLEETEQKATNISIHHKMSNVSFVPTDPRPFFLRPSHVFARVVEFYSPWCGQSQKFVNTFITAARQAHHHLPEGVILDFYAVSCSEHRDLCEEQNVTEYPTIRAYQEKSIEYMEMPTTFGINNIEEALQLGIDTTAEDDVHAGSASTSGTIHVALGDGDDGRASHVNKLDILGASLDGYRRTRTDIFRDAALSFTYALERHVYHNGVDALLSQERANALSEWLDLLYWTLPPTWMLHALIHDLRINFQEITTSKTSLLELVSKHHQVVHEINSNEELQWSAACQKDDSRTRQTHVSPLGFQCGTWALFHIVSVGVVERHSAVLGARDRVSANHAAETLYHYMKQFGSSWCKECQQSFVNLYDKCAYHRCKRLQWKSKGPKPPPESHWREFPMWLWQIHNGIHEELLRKETRRQHGRKPTKSELIFNRWPSKRECSFCYRPNGRWDEEAVLSFLKKKYWPGGVQNFRFVVLDKKDRSKERTHESSGSFLMRFCLAVGLSLIFIVPGIRMAQSSRRVRIHRTGRHKKFDDAPPLRRRLPP